MKYDPSREKSDKNTGLLWCCIYCYRAEEANLYSLKSKQGFPAALWGAGRYGGWVASWWWSGAMDTVYTSTIVSTRPSTQWILPVSYVYIPLCGCVWYVHVCGGACVHMVHMYGDLMLALVLFSINSEPCKFRAWSSAFKLAWLASSCLCLPCIWDDRRVLGSELSGSQVCRMSTWSPDPPPQ